MDRIRLLYECTGRSAWSSHLDTMRTLQRALHRASVPVRYSEGFNPHALISVLLPLSVGTESLCQLADVRLRGDVDLAALPGTLNAVLPEGLRVQRCYENGAKPGELKWLRVKGTWEYGGGDMAAAAEALAGRFRDTPVQVTRRTKRREGTLVLSDHLRDLTFSPRTDSVAVEAVISAAEPVINPEWIADAVAQNWPELRPEGTRFCRQELYREDMSVFR